MIMARRRRLILSSELTTRNLVHMPDTIWDLELWAKGMGIDSAEGA